MSKRRRRTDDPPPVDPPAFVGVEECRTKMATVNKLELALFGEDGRGGMVNEVTCIRTKLDTATGIVRSVVIPIVVPVGLAVAGYLIGKLSGM